MDNSQRNAIIVVALLGAATAGFALWGATSSNRTASHSGILAQIGPTLASLGHKSRVALTDQVTHVARGSSHSVLVLPSNSTQPDTVSISVPTKGIAAIASYEDNAPRSHGDNCSPPAPPDAPSSGGGNCSLPANVPNPQVVCFPVQPPKWSEYSSEAASNSGYITVNPTSSSITVSPCGGKLTLTCRANVPCTFNIN